MGYSKSEVNPQLGSGLRLGIGLGLGLGLDSVRGSTISHKMKYLPSPQNLVDYLQETRLESIPSGLRTGYKILKISKVEF